jgi:hypothetical protein
METATLPMVRAELPSLVNIGRDSQASSRHLHLNYRLFIKSTSMLNEAFSPATVNFKYFEKKFFSLSSKNKRMMKLSNGNASSTEWAKLVHMTTKDFESNFKKF